MFSQKAMIGVIIYVTVGMICFGIVTGYFGYLDTFIPMSIQYITDDKLISHNKTTKPHTDDIIHVDVLQNDKADTHTTSLPQKSQEIQDEPSNVSHPIKSDPRATYYSKVITQKSPYQYTPPPSVSNSETGKTFNVSKQLLKSLHIPMKNFSILSMDTVADFVFVTAASSNHFMESREAIGRLQKYMPEHEIIYYDMGLQDQQVNELKTFCNVKYKKFDFTKYPEHVATIHTFAFKPLIVHDALVTHRAIVWLDASVRFIDNLNSTYSQILKTGGYISLRKAKHSNFAVTMPAMYKYIITTKRKQKVNAVGANICYWHRTETVYMDILYWWVLCALDLDCIAPTGSTVACFEEKGDPPQWDPSTYYHCHRFDMSALNLLLANKYKFNYLTYLGKTFLDIVFLNRTAHYDTNVKICPS